MNRKLTDMVGYDIHDTRVKVAFIRCIEMGWNAIWRTDKMKQKKKQTNKNDKATEQPI